MPDFDVVLNLSASALQILVLDDSPLGVAYPAPVSLELVDDVFVVLPALDEAVGDELALDLEELVVFLHEGAGGVGEGDVGFGGSEGEEVVELGGEGTWGGAGGELEAVGEHLVDAAKDILLSRAAGLQGQPQQVQVFLDDGLLLGEDF
jgi:hypothetical protein